MINIALCVATLLSLPLTLERVVAVVGADPVLHSDVISLMIESGISEEAGFAADPADPAYQLAMEQLIEEKLLVEAARREGIYPSREIIQQEVDAAIAEIRTSFPSEQEFMNYLASMGMTIAAYREIYTDQMGDKIASENYVRAKAGTAMSALPADPVAFFNDNPETVEEILAPTSISWIYLPVLAQDTDEATELLTGVRNQIENGEITFSAAASMYSQDGSAASGGDLEWFTRGDMTSTFEKAVYDLSPGEIAGPFNTPFGTHLVKLTDRDGENVRASHIIIIAELTNEDLNQTIQQAEELISEIETGLNFAEAVSLHSYDPKTYDSEGFLGTVNIGIWEGEMRQAVVDLNAGDLSSPVPIEQGMAVAIFKKNADQSVDWDEFSTEELNSMLQSVFWHKYYTGMIESLRDEIPVQVNI